MQHIKPYEPRGQAIPESDRQELARLTADRGDVAVAALLRMSRQTLAKCLAGLPVTEGTRCQVREGLREIHSAA